MKVKAIIISMILLLSVTSFAFAASTSSPAYDVKANVDEQLALDITIFRGNVVGGTEVSEMNYGKLVRDYAADGTPYALKGESHFTVLMGCNTSKRAYTVTQTATAITKVGGSTTLPQGAYVVTPHNNGNASLPGTLGAAGCPVGTKTIYTSNTAGDAVVFAAAYTLTNDPAVTGADKNNFIPPDQAAGDYAGTVTFTLATVAP